MSETFIIICQENQNLVKIEQKYWTLNVKIQIYFIVAGNIQGVIDK